MELDLGANENNTLVAYSFMPRMPVGLKPRVLVYNEQKAAGDPL